MKPDYIYLLRHGESAGNVDKGIYKTVPDWKVPLTPRGREQAVRASKVLEKALEEADARDPMLRSRMSSIMIYASPWYRARETAKIVNDKLGDKGGRIYEDPRLREQEWGNFQVDSLKLRIQKERYRFGSFFYRMPEGESGADVYDRVSGFLETLHRDFDKPNYPNIALIVSHGLTIRCFIMRFFHQTVEEFESYHTPGNCQLIKMTRSYATGKYELVSKLRKRHHG